MTSHPPSSADEAAVPAPPDDALWTAVSDDGLLRARAARTTSLVAEALSRHRPGPLGALAMGRALSAAAVFPVEWEKFDRISLQWSGGGPLGSVFAELRAPGHLRARLTHPQAEPRSPLSGTQRGASLGLLPGGYLSVLRQAPRGGHTHGQVPLVNGEVDEDLERYFADSEQVTTRLRALLTLAGDEIVAAGGILVQALPGAAEAELEELTGPMGPLGPGAVRRLEALDAQTSPEAWLEAAFGRPFRVLERRALAFRCACSRERAAGGIALLEQDEIIDMVVKDKGADVTCEYCNEAYRFSADELLGILDDKAAQTSTREAGEA